MIRSYVVTVRTRCEKKLCATIIDKVKRYNLQGLVHNVYIPTQQILKKGQIVHEPLFPGYIYIDMILTNKTYSLIKQIPGVYAFICNEGNPTPLPVVV